MIIQVHGINTVDHPILSNIIESQLKVTIFLVPCQVFNRQKLKNPNHYVCISFYNSYIMWSSLLEFSGTLLISSILFSWA